MDEAGADGTGGAPRRRRRRATAAQGAPPPSIPTPNDPAVAQPVTAQPVTAPPADGRAPATAPAKAPVTAPAKTAAKSAAKTPAKRARPARDTGERGMRDLVGAGKSQLGLSAALRGRDVNRPTDDDLAEAEATLVIVRRHWQPADRK